MDEKITAKNPISPKKLKKNAIIPKIKPIIAQELYLFDELLSIKRYLRSIKLLLNYIIRELYLLDITYK